VRSDSVSKVDVDIFQKLGDKLKKLVDKSKKLVDKSKKLVDKQSKVLDKSQNCSSLKIFVAIIALCSTFATENLRLPLSTVVAKFSLVSYF